MRALLEVVIVAAVALSCASCRANPSGESQPLLMSPADLQSLPMQPPDQELTYGEDPNQVAELRIPSGRGPYPVVVLIHGGCWKSEYAVYREFGPVGDILKADGIATWNIEYRRLRQNGSGWPGTYLDVGHAIDKLRTMATTYPLDLDRVVVVGHSAGGHLAMWAAMRRRLPAQSPVFIENPLPLRGVVNLAGTIDMRENIANMEEMCGDRVVTDMLGGTPSAVPERYREVSAPALLPLGVRQRLIWGEYEDYVPQALAEQYVGAATRAGDDARLILVPGAGHFEIVMPTTDAWSSVREAIHSLLRE